MSKTVTVSEPTVYVLNLIARGVKYEESIRAEMWADRNEGFAYMAEDIRCPGRQMDQLEDMGAIRYEHGAAVLTASARLTIFKVAAAAK